ncbi:MAG: spermidine/putrescine ABC transporter substrate-binding protein [Burkholderiales bacterium]|nr:spermidine/putrescine ABC transporter substrate-binding protein [Burkholderiales bacterium]
MKRLLIPLLLICSYTIHADANKELNIFIAANYLAPQTATGFRQTNGYEVIQNFFNENDVMLAKMAAGLNGYDLIVPTSYAVDQLEKMHKLQPLDLKKIPNLKYVDKQFLNLDYDKGNKYSVPYAYDNVFLAYNKKELKKLGIIPNTWAVIFDPKYLKKLHGRVTVFDSPRNVFAAALLYLGKDPNSSDMKDLIQARDTILKAAPYWKRFDSDSYTRNLANGGIYVAMSYSVDIFKTLEDMKDSKQEINIGTMMQKEGNLYELDNLVIPASVKNTDAAYKFINYALLPKSALELTTDTGASIMNTEALKSVSPEIKAMDWIYPKDMSKMHTFKAYSPKIRIWLNETWLEIQLNGSCH